MISDATVGKVIEEFKGAGLEAEGLLIYRKKNLKILEKMQNVF